YFLQCHTICSHLFKGLLGMRILLEMEWEGKEAAHLVTAQ
ncbi:MAG: hypothetical protein ACI8TS_000816, partial [Flavobacteriales bacterium]